MENWIKREKRVKAGMRWRRIILFALLAIAIGLYAWRFYPALFKFKSYLEVVSQPKSLSTELEIIALVQNIYSELRLGKTEIARQPADPDDRQTDFPVIRSLWPADFPYVWFTDRIQRELSAYANLSYSAIESESGKNLLVYFLVPELGDTLAEIQLIGSPKTQPEISSIAFVFNNFADFKIQDALELTWLDLPFGYILAPDQIPGDKLAKALKASPGQCILEMPDDRETWELIMKSHRIAGNIKNNAIDQNNLRIVLNAFPGLDGFYFIDSGNQDREVIRIIIGQAETLRLTYIIQEGKISYADSLAYLKGMKIKELSYAADCLELSPMEIKSHLIHQANDFTKYDKGIYFIESKSENVSIIKDLRPLFKKLNIVLAKPLRIANTVDNL